VNGASQLAQLRLSERQTPVADPPPPPPPPERAPEGFSDEDEQFNEAVVPTEAWQRLIHEWTVAHTAPMHRGRMLELYDAYVSGLAAGLYLDPEKIRCRVIEVTGLGFA
jgi:hypothetical protein